MPSACINNCPRISNSPNTNNQHSLSISKLDYKPDVFETDFEFRLENSVTMLPADELFSDGKLLPLHLSLKNSFTDNTTSPETVNSHRRPEFSISDQYLFSPKAPRCSTRWKEILGLKKLYQSASMNKTASLLSSSSSSCNNKSLKHFLHRKTTSLTSEKAPFMKDNSDSESVSVSSSRLSLSSTSSSHRNPNNSRIRFVKPKLSSFENNSNIMNKELYPGTNRVGFWKLSPESGAIQCRGVPVDSPRMNSSGKIVFQSLERSSSSPSSFNGGPQFKYRNRGMERSYSANVRVTPVLNVPVCSLIGASRSGSVFGFGPLLSSRQMKEVGISNGGPNKGHQCSVRNRCQRSSQKLRG